MSRELSYKLGKILPRKFERSLRIFWDKNIRKFRLEKLPDEIYHQSKYNTIAFCTTCMNRLYQLKETLKVNITDNQSYPKLVFVLIDYNSQDGLEEYVKKNLSKYINKGTLVYYKTNQPQKFHASKAKNLAHFLADADIVCNVDGDNFTGKDFAFYINYIFNKYGSNHIFQFHKPPFWGTIGRLALSKENFIKLGGYDENLLPIGHEDMDLVQRAISLGLPLRRDPIENFQKFISNSLLEKAANSSDDETYTELENANKQISKKNIEAGLFVANTNGLESFTIYRNFSEDALNSVKLINIPN